MTANGYGLVLPRANGFYFPNFYVSLNNPPITSAMPSRLSKQHQEPVHRPQQIQTLRALKILCETGTQLGEASGRKAVWSSKVLRGLQGRNRVLSQLRQDWGSFASLPLRPPLSPRLFSSQEAQFTQPCWAPGSREHWRRENTQDIRFSPSLKVV